MADDPPQQWMIPCPECGIPIEPGSSPLGLARHSCDYVKSLQEERPQLTTLERAREAALTTIISTLPSMTPPAMIETLRALYEMGAVTGATAEGLGLTPGMQAWITRTEEDREVD